MSKIVRKTLADSPLTTARRRKLAQAAERPDAEIDFSDIPPRLKRASGEMPFATPSTGR
jgi:hypothetical protein